MEFLEDKIRKIVCDGMKKGNFALPVRAKPSLLIEYPADASHGDYSTNIAFELGKSLKKNPRAAAEELIKNLKIPPWIEKVEIAGAGFINFFLAPEFLAETIDEIEKEGDQYGKSDVGKGKTIVTDSSHPNVAKPMGVHHLLSTIIGDSLNRMLAAVGYTVIKDNYLGDWGTQFGKLIYAIKTWGDEKVIKKNPIPELLKLYVKFHDEVETNEKLEEHGRAEFKKLEEGDKENRALWKWIVELSLAEFQKIWKRLDVSYDYIHGESFYEDKMQAIIEMGIKKKIFVEGEGGALIAPFPHEKYPPCIIRKSDGATLYATRDLARTKYWEDTWHPDFMIMIADSAQIMHFQQFFEVAEMLGITDAKNIHVSFGRMSFPEKKMSTRKGNMVLLDEVLDEAVARTEKIVEEKNPDLSAEKRKIVAHQVGLGAVKYAVLSQNRLTNVTFTWDKMLSLEGNSAPYLQYVHARARAILRKDQKSKIKNQKDDKEINIQYVLREPQELAVARMLPKFPEVIARAAAEFRPNILAHYLFELASRFNSFYAAVPVLHAEPEARAHRVRLVNAVSIILKNGLALLGVEAPEEM